MINPGKRWYAVQTHPAREPLAAQQLAKQNFQVFLPKQRKTVRHARRLQHKQVAYFPGYIFVALDLGMDRWRAVNGTFGVRGLVMCGDRPAAAPAGFIEYLRAEADDQDCLVPPPGFQPGDRVKLLAGPFADLVGVMDRLEGGARVRILVDIFSGVMPVVAEAQNVALAS